MEIMRKDVIKMDFIEKEKFMNQSERVKNALMDWWQPKKYDLVFDTKTNKEVMVAYSLNKVDLDVYIDGVPKARYKNQVTPLFNETQLRHFILDKTHGFITLSLDNSRTTYHITIEKLINNKLEEVLDIDANNMDLLEAYWRIDCKIAE